MRRCRRVAALLVSLALSACSAGYASSEPPAEPEVDKTAGWPTDAPALVAHLNTWSHKELEAYERPDLDLQRHLNAVAGDTGEWVDLHKEKLQKLGVAIRWNRESRVYEIDR